MSKRKSAAAAQADAVETTTQATAPAAKPKAPKAPKAPKPAPAPVVEQDEEAGDEEAKGSKMSNQLKAARVRYIPTLAASGKKSLSNGDELALHFAGKEPDQVVAAAESLLGMAAGELAGKYAHLNQGARRMNAVNRLRGAIRQGKLTIAQIVGK